MMYDMTLIREKYVAHEPTSYHTSYIINHTSPITIQLHFQEDDPKLLSFHPPQSVVLST